MFSLSEYSRNIFIYLCLCGDISSIFFISDYITDRKSEGERERERERQTEIEID